MKDLNLIDIWRHLNPLKKEYSCFSGTHNSYSRIDYFLVSAELLSNIRGCHHNSIVISDHAVVSLTLVEPKLIRKSPKWRFQLKWMQDSKFLKFLGEQIDNYFELNTTQTSATTRWEAFKAFIRGQIISYTSSKTKEVNKITKQLEHDIKILENKSFQEGQNKQ